MTTSESKIIVKLEAEVGKLTTELSKAQKRISAFEQQSGSAAKNISSAFTGMAGRLAGPLAAVLSVREVVQYADAWTNLANRLKLVTDSAEELAIAQSDVFSIAQETRQSLDSSAALYFKVASNADALGLSLREVAGIVETVSQATAISGASAEEAAASILQFGQALGSGVLQGDELKSILENNKGLADAIAQGLGVTTGALRQMGKDGELTAERVVSALQKVAGTVEADFQKTNGTVGQAFTQLGNALTKTIGYFDKATGASGSFARGIKNAADAISSISDDQVGALERKREQLRSELDIGLMTKGISDESAKMLQKQIATITSELANLQSQREVIANNKPLKFGDAVIDMNGAQAAFDAAGAGLERFSAEATRARTAAASAAKAQRDGIVSVLDSLDREIATLGKTTTEIQLYDLYQKGATAADLEAARAKLSLIDAYEQQQELLRSVNDDVEAANVSSIEDFADAEQKRFDDILGTAQGTFDGISVYADQAARNMQDAFADFLFDPFKDGLDGMLKGFGQILQLMVAEAAAAQIFDAVLGKQGTGGSRSGGLLETGLNAAMAYFGGARATGGPVEAGRSYMVGERGPEMFVPQVAGRIEPNSGGGDTYNVSVSVPGASTPEQAAMAGGAAGRAAVRAIDAARRYS